MSIVFGTIAAYYLVTLLRETGDSGYRGSSDLWYGSILDSKSR